MVKVKTRSGLPHMEMCSYPHTPIMYCYPHFSSPECTHSFPHFFFFLPVERGIGRHDNNRLSKAPSTSHTSYYLTRTVQANACEGVFPMLVIKVKTRSGSPYPHNVLLPQISVRLNAHTPSHIIFFLPVERGEVGRLDKNRLSKAPSSSHTSHYLTRTVQVNAYEGDFPMLVLPVAVHVI